MPLVATLTDPFAGPTLAAHWASSFGTITVDGTLDFTFAAGAFSGVETTTDDWELTGSGLFVAIGDVIEAELGTTQVLLSLKDSVTTDGELRVGYQDGQLIGEVVTAGPTFTPVFSITYDPVAQRFVHLAEAGGTIAWSTSPDGATTTSRGTADAATDLDFGIAALNVRHVAGSFGATGGASGSASFDHLNIIDQTVTVDAVTVGVVVGTPTIAADQIITVDAVTIPVVVGDDLGVGIDQTITVDAVTIPVVVGQPTLTFVLEPPPPTPPQPQGVQPGQLEWRELRLGDGTPYRVHRLEGLTDRPPARSSDQERLQRHGQLPGEDFLGPRTISATIIVTGRSASDFRENYRVLQAALSPVGPEETLVFRSHVIADGGERLVSARIRHADTPRRTPMTARVEVQWHATNPRILGIAPVTRLAKADAASSGVVFPIAAPLIFGTLGESGRMVVRNTGNFPAPVELLITGPCTGPAVRNTRTGAALEFDIALGNGQVLVIDSGQRTVLLNGNTNAYSTLVSEGWFDISPGETSLHFTTVTGTSATLRATFRSAWIM